MKLVFIFVIFIFISGCATFECRAYHRPYPGLVHIDLDDGTEVWTRAECLNGIWP